MSETYQVNAAGAISEFAPGADGTILHGDCEEDALLAFLHSIDPGRWPLNGPTLRGIVQTQQAQRWGVAANGAAPLSAAANHLAALGIEHTVYGYAEPFTVDWHSILLANAGRRPILLQFANAGALPGDERGVQYHFACVLGVNPSGYAVSDGDNVAAYSGKLVTYSYGDLVAARVCGMIVGPVVAHTGATTPDASPQPQPQPQAATAQGQQGQQQPQKTAGGTATVSSATNGNGGATAATKPATPVIAVDANGRPTNANAEGLGPLMAAYVANHPQIGKCVSGGEFYYDTTPEQNASFAGFTGSPAVLMTYKGQIRDDIGGYGVTALYALLRTAEKERDEARADLATQAALAAKTTAQASDLQAKLTAAGAQIEAMTHTQADLQAQATAAEERATAAEAAASAAEGKAAPAATLLAALTAAIAPAVLAALAAQQGQQGDLSPTPSPARGGEPAAAPSAVTTPETTQGATQGTSASAETQAAAPTNAATTTSAATTAGEPTPVPVTTPASTPTTATPTVRE